MLYTLLCASAFAIAWWGRKWCTTRSNTLVTDPCCCICTASATSLQTAIASLMMTEHCRADAEKIANAMLFATRVIGISLNDRHYSLVNNTRISERR